VDHYCYNILFIGYKRLCPVIILEVPTGMLYLYIPAAVEIREGMDMLILKSRQNKFWKFFRNFFM